MVEMKQVVSGYWSSGRHWQTFSGKPATDSYRDAWYVGFTPDIVTAVWVGTTTTPLVKGLTGGRYPL